MAERFADLPNELKSLVFIAALPTITSAGGIQPYSIRQPPLNIANVCRTWRDISLSTPQLWSQIYYRLDESCRGNAALAREISRASSIGVFVERSASAPLFINVWAEHHGVSTIRDITSQDWRELGRAITQPLIKCQERWKMANIGIATELLQFAYDECSWSLNNARIIEELDIRKTLIARNVTIEKTEPFIFDISNSSQLRKLYISNLHRTVLEVSEHASFPNLQACTIGPEFHSFTFNTISAVLKTSPRLVDLKVSLPKGDFEGTRDEILCHESLRSLVVRGDMGWIGHETNLGKVKSFIDHLELPSLQILKLSCRTDGDANILSSSVRNILRRSRASLTKLSLHLDTHRTVHRIIQVDGLLRLLDELPFLEDLLLDLGEYSFQRLLQHLTVNSIIPSGSQASNIPQGPHVPAVCPLLRSLNLGYIDVDECIESIAEMLTSRSPVGDRNYSYSTCDGGSVPKEPAEDDRTAKSRGGTALLHELVLLSCKPGGEERAHGHEDIADLRRQGLKLTVWG